MQGLLLLVSTLVVFIGGYWLHHLGTPYNTLLLTIHKLLAVTIIVIVGMHVYQVHQKIDFTSANYVLVLVAGIAVLGTIVSGGLISAVESPNITMLWVHRILPYFTTILLIWIYLIGRKPDA